MEKKSKKILFVINTLGHAGAEVALLELMRRLRGYSVELSLYVLMDQGELIHEVPDDVHVLNRNFCDVSVLSEQGRKHMRKKVLSSAVSRGAVFRNIPYLVGSLAGMLAKGRVQPDKLLWRVISQGAPAPNVTYDLAVAYLEGGSAYYVAERVTTRKKAAFIHIDYQLAGYTRKLDKDCYARFDRIFTVSGEVKEKFLEVYPECAEKTSVFHNMLDEEKIRRRAREPGGFDDDFQGTRILTVGRLVYQKAYDIAIDAMKLMKDAGYPVRWYVLGEGDLREELTARIARLGLSEDFLLLGARKNPYPYYLQTDLYAHMTRFEGKSIAIQEAQILGCTIIASDCSGNREQIIDGEDGVLCPLEPERIRDAVGELLRDRHKAALYGERALHKQTSYEEDLRMLLDLLG